MNPHSESIEKIVETYKTTLNGISITESKKRLIEFGKNELKQNKQNQTFKLILHQFQDIMILLLFIAAIVSFIIGEINDAIVILIILIINALIGFIHEFKANKAIDALKKLSALQAKVKRSNNILTINATEIVPGDCVLLESGMIVPADIRLTEVHALKIEEASLTGESNAIEKNWEIISQDIIPLGDRINMAYKSTIITHGRGQGIAIATGMNTEIGKIANLLSIEDRHTPLQIRLSIFEKKLSIVVILISILVFISGIIRNDDWVKMLLTSISVAVAAIPEALPAVVTIALAIGANKMIQKNVLIRKLSAVETLGAVTFICSDKTGTITQNKMHVSDVWTSPQIPLIDGYNKDEILLLALELNHDVELDENKQLKGDPTEVALVEFVRKQLHYKHEWNTEFIRKHELPFDSERKMMTTLFHHNNKWFIVCKGAVENVLDICNQELATIIKKESEKYANEGKRVLAFSIKLLDNLPEKINQGTIEKDMHFLGLIALIDSSRIEVKQAIQDCKAAGITPVMITGDHPSTATFIAKECGILSEKDDEIMTGKELESISENALIEKCEHIKVYARVSPLQKIRIIDCLQKKGHYVAMTGDGVNDAPALKKATIGIAMGISGTDVSKEAAHMILMDDNFATIIKAVKEGRRIYDNIQKFIKYILTSNSGEIWTILLAPIFALPIPLLPIHILWINLVTDGFTGIAFTYEDAEKNILNKKPRKPNEAILTRKMGIHVIWVGLLMACVCLIAQAWFIESDNSKWQTLVFTILSVSQMGHALAVKSNQTLSHKGFFKNKVMIVSILIALSLQMMVIYNPFLQQIFKTQSLSYMELIACLLLSSIVFFAVDIEKRIQFKRTL